MQQDLVPIGDARDRFRGLAPEAARLGGDRTPAPCRRSRHLLSQLRVLEFGRNVLDSRAGLDARTAGEQSQERRAGHAAPPCVEC